MAMTTFDGLISALLGASDATVDGVAVVAI